MATSLKGAATATIALKEGPYVAVSAEDGSMTPPDAGFGLYVHDVRFLSAFEVRVAGVAPLLLSASDRETYVATMQLVNPPLRLPDGRTVAQQALSIRRARFIDGGLRERIGLLNSGPATVPLELSIELDADFGDMFAVRGYRPSPPAAVTVERVAGGLLLSATGADGVLRQTRVTTDPAPDAVTDRTLRFGAKLAPQERFVIEVTVVPTEDGHRPEPGSERPFDAAIELLRDRYAAFLAAGTRIETGDGRLDDLLRRSALDLRALVDHTPSGPMLTAGIPWYAVPFGRDALITGLETLDFQPELALGALRFLAAHQGQRVDPFTEEEPGRIFHELRRGELARMGAVPHRPYFGTVDATPLFVRLFVETVRWLGDRRIYDELLPHALAALEWCDTHGDPDGDGFVEHSSLPGSPLRNKGWKDSATSLCYRDGSPVELPAALVEVQAYVYAAKDGLAQLSAELGDGALAERLAAEAAALRERFEAAFWLPAERCYAQALDAGKRPVDAVTSNAGHCLWAGIAAPEHATLLVERLLEPDMFTGWGIRRGDHRGPRGGRALRRPSAAGAVLRLRQGPSVRVATGGVPRLLLTPGLVGRRALPPAPDRPRPATGGVRAATGDRSGPARGDRSSRLPRPPRRGPAPHVRGPPHGTPRPRHGRPLRTPARAGGAGLMRGRPSVLFVHYTFPGVVGGVETVVAHHAAGLRDQANVRLLAGRGRTGVTGVQRIRIPLVDSLHPAVVRVSRELARGRVTPAFAELREDLAAALLPHVRGADRVVLHNVATMGLNLPLVAALHEVAPGLPPGRLIVWIHDLAAADARHVALLHPGEPWALLSRPLRGARYVAVSVGRQEQAARLPGIAPG